MSKKSTSLLIIVLGIFMLVLAAVPATAIGPTTKWVDQAAGSDANDGNSEAAAYATLQFAIDNSESGLDAANRSIINVKGGTYGGSGTTTTCVSSSAAIWIKDLDWLTIQAVSGHEPVVKPATAVPANTVSIVVENSDHLTIDNIDSDQTVAQFDNWHVCDSNDLTLRNSHFEGGEDGIDFNTNLTTALIENNSFSDINTGSGDEVLDFTDASYSDVVIQDNTFNNNYRQITINPPGGSTASNFTIRRNLMDTTTSEEAIRLVNASAIVVENNVILNSMQQGVYIDSGCSDITVRHNTFFNNDQEAGANGDVRTKILTSDIIIKDNIFYGNGANPAIQTTASSLPGEDYNLTFNCGCSSFTFGTNTIVGSDPLFVSTTAGSEDLHLTTGSPAIETGTDLGVTDDKDKNVRPNPAATDPDMGAYEFALATLTIAKTTIPAGGTDFPFTIDPAIDPSINKWRGNGSGQYTTILDDGQMDMFFLPAGDYHVSELVPQGWVLTNITCDTEGYGGFTPGDTTAQLSLFPGDDVTCTFTNTVKTASIKVNKDAEPSEVWEPGGDVEFIIDTRNNGDLPLTITDINDSYFGSLNDECDLPADLPVGQTFTCRFTEYIGGGGGDIHYNQVTVTAEDREGKQVSDTSDEDVHILDIPSSLKVKKDAAKSEVLEPGENLLFTVTAENTSQVDEVTIEQVTDSVFGSLTAECLPTGPKTLALGQTFTCNFTRFVGGTAGDMHSNIITVSGTDDDGMAVSDSDSEQVLVDNVASSIKVDLSAAPGQVYEPGDDVIFTVEIVNSSAADDVTINQVKDSVFGDITAECLAGGPLNLSPGETHTCTFTRFIGGQMGDTHTSLVTVLGIDDDGYGVSDSANESVLVLDTPSSLLVSKTADPHEVIAPGADVTFTVTVLNDSPSDEVMVNSLVDTVYPGIAGNCTPALPANLQPGESITCRLTTYIGGQAGDLYSSRVTAAGSDDDGYPVSDGAELSIHVVISPSGFSVFLPLTLK